MVQESARLGATQPSFETAAETMGRLSRIGISDSTVWRHFQEMGSGLETQLEQEEQEIPFYVSLKDTAAMEWIEPQEPIKEDASVSIDGVKILTRDAGYKEVKIVAVSEVVAEPEPQKSVSEPKATADDGKGSQAAAEKGRGRQDDIKLTAHSYRAVLGDKAAFVPALKGELARRRVRTAAKISTPNDGADWIWDLVEKYLPERRVEILDWSHAVQNLAKAGKAGWGEGTAEAQVWLEERKAELWNGDVVKVELGLEQLPRRYKERGDHIRQVKAYIDQHANRLRYKTFREEKRPIGSGTVESAARNVVTWRMKRGGQRWSNGGAIRMLVALGEVHSGRWEARMQNLAQAA